MGEGKEESEAPGRGEGRFLIEIPKKGVSQAVGGGEGLGGAGVFAGNLGGWGLNIFFGSEIPTKLK